MSRRTKPPGAEAFQACYQRWFPGGEWERIVAAMRAASVPALFFRKRDAARLQALWAEAGLDWKPLLWCPHALAWPSQVLFGQALPGLAERLFYPMNASSLVPPLALDVQPGDTVLDACAAPGGKTLLLAEASGANGTVFANDLSLARIRRLQETVAAFGLQNVRVSRGPAEVLFKKWPSQFDRILLDAPCSSEKHVMESARHLNAWSPARVRQLKQRQLALVCGLVLALRPGGRLAYSTCALAPEENEWVVGEVLKRKENVRLVDWTRHELPGGPGLPGFGLDPRNVRRIRPEPGRLDPMFVAVFERVTEGTRA